MGWYKTWKPETKDNIQVSVLSNLVEDNPIAQLGTDLEEEVKKQYQLYDFEIHSPPLLSFLFLRYGYSETTAIWKGSMGNFNNNSQLSNYMVFDI